MPISRNTDFSKWEIHGNNYTEPEWKADGVVSFDGFGLMTFRGTLQARDVFDLSNIQNYNVPMFGQDLGSAAEGFFVSKITKKLQPNQSALFDIEAIGIEPRCKGITRINAAPSASVSTEPIETHRNFAQIGGTPDAPLNGAIFDSKDRMFKGFAVVTADPNQPVNKGQTSDQPLAGVRSYYAPKQVFRGYFHCFASMYDVDTINGLLDTPILSMGSIQGIKLLPDWMTVQSDSGNWLLTAIAPEPVVVNTDGQPIIFKVSYECLRAQTVWNPLIYESSSV